MDIKQLIKQSHDNAIDKGFYPEDEDKNIGELLMLIVSELSEALEAHRNNRFSEWERGLLLLNSGTDENTTFEATIKNTFEDEIADVFIRLFDLCGYKDWELDNSAADFSYGFTSNIGESLLMFCHTIAHINKDAYNINILFNSLCQFCNHHNIPIEKHIKAKMAYNRTRPHKHGKEY